MDMNADKKLNNMIDVRMEINPSLKVPQVVVYADQWSDIMDKIVHAIEDCVEKEYSKITVFSSDGTMVLLNQWEIIRVFSQNRKLTVCTKEGTYESRQTLNKIEELLDTGSFVRISRFEIINLRNVKGFDLSFSGTIKVIFDDGTETWVARRYVKAIQQILRSEN